jgi:transketolase
MDEIAELGSVATRAKATAVRLVGSQGLGYLGQALSSAELLTGILGRHVRPGHDRFVLSPSHYVTGMYAVAAELRLLDPEELDAYGVDGSDLETIGSERSPVADFTCGSLAQGLSVAIGYALADRVRGEERRTAVLSSDGEMEEGQTWEAAMFAAHHALDAITVVLDCNDSQVDGPVSSVTTIEPVAAKWEAFGWEVVEIDGHDIAQVVAALDRPPTGRPRVIVARTTATGRLAGLEGDQDVHFVKLDPALTQSLLAELEGAS